MQRKWYTELADQLEGQTSQDKAILDISRAVRANLRHEGIGIYASAVPKNLSGNASYLNTGVLAIDRVKNLTWRNYKKIAQGKATIVPHTGNVDTLEIPIKQIGYTSYELMRTDLASLKHSGLYKATIAASITQTLAAGFDAEYFDLHAAAAAANKKGAVVEVSLNEVSKWKRGKLYLALTNLISKIEQIFTKHYIGVPRNEMFMIVSPRLYSLIIDNLPGSALAVEKILDWIQSEQIVASRIAGINFVRHAFLNGTVTESIREEGAEDDDMFSQAITDFKGIHAVIAHRASTFLVQIFQDAELMPNFTTGNYRYIERVKWDKGLVYGDLIYIIKEKSDATKPLPFETHLIDNRDNYNNNFGFRDEGFEIPDNIEDLQKRYLELDEELPGQDKLEPDWNYVRAPKDWSLIRYHNENQAIEVGSNYFQYDGVKYYFADEDWANNEGGMQQFGKDNKRCCNNYEFKRDNLNGKGITNFTLITKVSLGYTYGVPLYWTETNNYKPLVELKGEDIEMQDMSSKPNKNKNK